MADILNFNVQKDTILKDVIKGNPYYVNIQGSVNICHIRCGQKIETCNDVRFASMTNYGKILALNLQSGTNSKCKIQLAFDTSNTNIKDDGGADYKFDKAFFTVPALHRLNDQIHDMETFLIFSSTQKNGNVLYIILCVLNDGIGNIPKDGTLLNYRLLDSLFTQNNNVPDMLGTSAINGIPNPVDISNFIPPEGMRNFYDYTHPQNTTVNFRVFQKSMLISNSTLNILKSKLTPGDIYTNFKKYIGDSINPREGLFFYFSKDLTAEYKSFAANTKLENFDNDDLGIGKTSSVTSETSETSETSSSSNLKKLDIDEDIEKNDLDDLDSDKEKESFEADTDNATKDHNKKKSIIFACLIIAFNVIIYYFIFYQCLLNLFGTGINASPEQINEYKKLLANNVTNNTIQKVISIRVKYTMLNSGLIFFSFLIILCLTIYLFNDSNEIFGFIKFIGFCIVIILVFQFMYMVRYTFNRFKLCYDDDFSNKESALMEIVSKDWAKIFKNFKNIFSEDLKEFASETESIENKSTNQLLNGLESTQSQLSDNNPQFLTKNNNSQQQSGTGTNINQQPSDTSTNINQQQQQPLVPIQFSNPNMHIPKQAGGANSPNKPPVPAPKFDKDPLKLANQIAELDNLRLYPHFFSIFSNSTVRQKFGEHETLSYRYYLMRTFVIFAFILICFMQLYFLKYTENADFKNIFSYMCIMTVYVPLIILFIVMTYYITDKVWIQRSNLILGYITIFISIFISVGNVADAKKNIPFWLVFCFMVLMIFINIYSRFFAKFDPLEDTTIVESDPAPEEFIKKSEALDYYKKLLDKIDLLEHIIQLQPSQRNSGKYIQYLEVVKNLVTTILSAGTLSLEIEYKTKIVTVLQNLLQNINVSSNAPSINNLTTNIGKINNLKQSIANIINQGIILLQPETPITLLPVI